MNTTTPTISPETKAKIDKSIFCIKESDDELRETIADVICENPGDTNALNIILNQKDKLLTDNQRDWIAAVINRNGMSLAKFNKLFDEV